MTHAFENPAVKAKYDDFPVEIREMAMILRDLIFSVANETDGVGPVEEALRWGQPAYLTPKTKAGSTLRIGLAKGGGCAIYAHCGTDIISTYAATFGNSDRIEGNRAVIFHKPSDIVPDRLRLLVFHGLTYHLKR